MRNLSDDVAMRAFARFTDPGIMRTVWQEHLPTSGGSQSKITSCVVLYAHYKSYLRLSSSEKSTLFVCYQLQMVNDNGDPEQRLVYGKAYLKGRSHGAYADLLRTSTPLDSNRAAHIPALDMLVWRFPDDPQLPQLSTLVDSQRVIPHLPYHALPIAGPQEVSRVDVQVVHYRPECRCTIRYVLHFQENGRPQKFLLFGKTFANDLGHDVLRRMTHFWSTVPTQLPRVAQPLGYSESLHTVWQQGVEGDSLLEVLSAGNTSEPMAAMGNSLAALHRSDCPTNEEISLEARLLDAHKKARKLRRAFPEVSPALQVLITQAEDELDTLPPAPDTLLHGDMHLRQFLQVNQDVMLFDFDELAHGDPALDLASFIVDLYMTDMKDRRIQQLLEVFLRAYQSHARWPVSGARIAWHARLQLLNKAYRFYLQQEPDVRGKIQHVLALATTNFAKLGQVTE